tara:strand:+ start:72 stop:1808 length:1737 start_codon:yes stop_codon:yes gene_type:complete
MKKLLYIFLGLSLVFGCSDDSAEDSNEPCSPQPLLQTTAVTLITFDINSAAYQATLNGNINNTPTGANCEVQSVTSQGFVYDTTVQPTTSDAAIEVNGQQVSTVINGLSSETIYYVRTYITNPLGTFYGNEVSFETSATPDSDAPVITLLGANPQSILTSGNYEELGATAIDDMDGDISSYIEISSNVNAQVTGSYEVVYSISDSSGNTASATRTVDVYETPIYIGENGITIKAYDWAEVGMEGNLLGYTRTVVDYDLLVERRSAGINDNTAVTTKFTDMSGLFAGRQIAPGMIERWDVSNVTTMSGMFNDCSGSGNLNNWDVSNVTTMSGMFVNSGVIAIPKGDWDVSNVTDMSHMFYKGTSTPGDILNWDVSNVTDMSGMFQESVGGSVNDWDVSSVTNMNRMYYESTATTGTLNNWDVSSVTDMSEMFAAATSMNYHIGDWDVSSVTTMLSMFQYASAFNQPIGDWDVSSVTDMSHMFQKASSFNQPIHDWDVSSVTTMLSMFEDCVPFNQSIGDWDVSGVTNMRWMFSSYQAYINFNQDLASWDVDNVTECTGFSESSTYWTLPQPNFTNCDPN